MGTRVTLSERRARRRSPFRAVTAPFVHRSTQPSDRRFCSLGGHLWTTPVENFDPRFTWNRSVVDAPRRHGTSSLSPSGSSFHVKPSDPFHRRLRRRLALGPAAIRVDARVSLPRVRSKQSAATATVRRAGVAPQRCRAGPAEPPGVVPLARSGPSVPGVSTWSRRRRPGSSRRPPARPHVGPLAPQGAEQDPAVRRPVVPRGTNPRLGPATRGRHVDRLSAVARARRRHVTHPGPIGHRMASPHGCRARVSPCPPSGRSTWNSVGRTGCCLRRLRDDAEPRSVGRVSRRNARRLPTGAGPAPAASATSSAGASRRPRPGHARPHRRDSPARGDGHRRGASGPGRASPRDCRRGWIRVPQGSTAFHLEQSAADTPADMTLRTTRPRAVGRPVVQSRRPSPGGMPDASQPIRRRDQVAGPRGAQPRRQPPHAEARVSRQPVPRCRRQRRRLCGPGSAAASQSRRSDVARTTESVVVGGLGRQWPTCHPIRGSARPASCRWPPRVIGRPPAPVPTTRVGPRSQIERAEPAGRPRPRVGGCRLHARPAVLRVDRARPLTVGSSAWCPDPSHRAPDLSPRARSPVPLPPARPR